MKSLRWGMLLSFVCAVAGLAGSSVRPELVFSSYLGGRGFYGESAYALSVGEDGRITVGGYSASTNFPMTSLFGPQPDPSRAFVTTVSPGGDNLLSSAIFPEGIVRAIARDRDGNLCVVGDCYYGFPVTNAYQSEFGGSVDVFALKLSPGADKLLFSTYIGGSREDMARSLAVDGQGNFHICGWTTSTNFPGRAISTRPGQFDGFYVELDASGGKLVRSVVFGGDADELANSLALDGVGGVYIGGWTQGTNWAGLKNGATRAFGSLGWQTAFVLKIGAGANCPFDSLTLLGGSENQTLSCLRLTSRREVVVFGRIESSDFPVTANCWQPAYAGEGDYYLAKLSASGSALVFATYFGGSQSENPTIPEYTPDRYVYPDTAGMALDAADNIFIGARTSSSDIAAASAMNTFNGYEDGFVAKFRADGSALEYFLYLGGTGFDAVHAIGLDAAGNIYASGQSMPITPPYFPTTPGAFQSRFGGNESDAFIVKLAETAAAPANDAFAHAVSLQGSRTTILGSNRGASAEPGEPPCGASAGGETVWWTWTAPSSGRLSVTTAGSNFDTVLAVFAGTQTGALTRIAANDNAFDGIQTSQVSLPVSAGISYRIAVDGADGAQGGIVLSLTLSVPLNDDFASRIGITNFPADLRGSNVDATREADENQAHTDGLGTRSVWWQWNCPLTGNVLISTAGSDFDSRLAVYAGDSMGNLQLVAVNDNATNGVRTSEVSIQATARAQYQIAVDSVYDDSGSVRLQILPGEPPANDNFAKRTRIDAAYTNIVAYNYGASREPAEPDFGTADRAGKTLWWTWTAPADGRLTLSTFDSDFDSLIAVFTGDALNGLSLLAFSDNSMKPGANYYNASVNLEVKAGQTCHVAVDGRNYWGGGEIRLKLHHYVPPVILANTVVKSPVFQFSAQGQPGKSYFVAGSTNLEDWIPVGTNLYSGSLFECVVPSPGAATTTFYRLVEK